MKTSNITFGSILAFVAVATLPYLGKVQYAPRIGADVAGVALVVVLVMLWSVTLIKKGSAYTAAKVIGFILASLLGLFAWFLGLLLTGQSALRTEPLIVGLICVLFEAAGSIILFRNAFRKPPIGLKAAKTTKIVLGSILFLMTLVSILGIYEATVRNRSDRATIYALFALVELAISLALFISASKRRELPGVPIKQCPQCERTYDDLTLNYCLDDGAILVNPSDPNATLVNPPRFVT